MKRFLSLLTVFALAFSLAVPAHAFNYEDDYIDFTFDEEFNTSSFNGMSLNYNFYVDQVVWRYHCHSISVDDGAMYYKYKVVENLNNGSVEEKDVTESLTAYSSTTNSWGGGLRTVYFPLSILEDEDAVTSLELVGSFGEYAVEQFCDGSACPATDANIDGICDDCGMMLMSLSRTPVAPYLTGSNKNYVMFYSGTVYKYTVYTSDESYTIRGEEYGARYRTYTDPSVTVTRYESYDGINWEQTYTGKTANDYPGEIGYELISSTFNWYTEAGDRFFPVPLWEEVQTVTQGEMGTLVSETAGTMTTLVACGVGLMACLMALSLFGKRWLLFLR